MGVQVRVLVKYAGLLAEILGRESEYLEVPTGLTVKALLEVMAQRNANFKNWVYFVPLLHVYVNGVEVTGQEGYYLKDGDEVVLMTPLYEGG